MGFFQDLWDRIRLLPMAGQAGLAALLVVLLAGGAFALTSGGGDSENVAVGGKAATTTVAANSDGFDTGGVTTTIAGEVTTTIAGAVPVVGGTKTGGGNTATTAKPASGSTATTAPPAGAAGCSTDASGAIANGVSKTFLSNTAMEFSLYLDKAYVDVGLSGTGKRTSGGDWQINAHISGIPLIGEVDVVFLIVGGEGYISAPGVLETFTGGATWGHLGPVAIAGSDPSSALAMIAPSPAPNGEETAVGVHTCKYTQANINVTALIAAIPGDISGMVTQFVPGIATAAPGDLHFFIADGGEIRLVTGVMGGSEVLKVEVTKWGTSGSVQGAPDPATVAEL